MPIAETDDVVKLLMQRECGSEGALTPRGSLRRVQRPRAVQADCYGTRQEKEARTAGAKDYQYAHEAICASSRARGGIADSTGYRLFKRLRAAVVSEDGQSGRSGAWRMSGWRSLCKRSRAGPRNERLPRDRTLLCTSCSTTLRCMSRHDYAVLYPNIHLSAVLFIVAR